MIKKPISVAIVILHWQYHQFTIECLKSLQKIKNEKIKITIYLLDNGSTNHSDIILSKFIKGTPLEIKFFHSRKNLGFAKGNNFLIKKALKNKFDYVCLLNNDTEVEKNFLSTLISIAEKENQIGAVGGKIYLLDKSSVKKQLVLWYAGGGPLTPQEIYPENRGYRENDHGQYNKTEETDFITGCLFLVKAKIFDEIGFFDERFFHTYEDVDFSLRIKRAGFKLVYCSRAVIWHHGSASSSPESEFMNYFTTKGAFLYAWKWLPLTTKIHSIKEGVRLLFKGSFWQRVAVLDFFRRRFGRGSWIGDPT